MSVGQVAEGAGFGDGFLASVDVEFVLKGDSVFLHRRRSDQQLAGDLLVGVAVGQHDQHIEFAAGQRRLTGEVGHGPHGVVPHPCVSAAV